MAGSRAIGELYDAAYPRLVLQLFAICGDQVDAEDAVQEAFVKALAAGAAFDRVDKPEAWLRKVALNHQRNVWRRTGVARRFLTRVPGPRQTAELDPDHVAVMDALAQLDLDHRTVLVLHHLGRPGHRGDRPRARHPRRHGQVAAGAWPDPDRPTARRQGGARPCLTSRSCAT